MDINIEFGTLLVRQRMRRLSMIVKAFFVMVLILNMIVNRNLCNE